MVLLVCVQGGELFSRLQGSDTPGRITPAEARFYAACVLDAFEYIHSMGIIYRDLKVRVVVTSGGHCDLALARVYAIVCADAVCDG